MREAWRWRGIDLPNADPGPPAGHDVVEIVGLATETASNIVFPQNMIVREAESSHIFTIQKKHPAILARRHSHTRYAAWLVGQQKHAARAEILIRVIQAVDIGGGKEIQQME